MSQDSPTPEELRALARAPQPQQSMLSEREFDPEEARQPRPISGHPIVKLSVVGGSLLPIFLFAGIFLGSKQPAANQNLSGQPRASSQPDDNPDDSSQSQQREKLGKAEAQLALEKQRIAFAQARQTTNPKQPSNLTNLSKPSEPPRGIAVESRPTYSPPAVSDIPRQITPPSTIDRASAPSPVKLSRAEENLDSNGLKNHSGSSSDRYQALAQIGSYGEVSTPIEVEQRIPEWSQASVERTSQSRLISPVEVASIQDEQTPEISSRTLSNLSETAVSILNAEETAILEETPLHSMVTGTTAEGVLQTSVILNDAKQQMSRTQSQGLRDGNSGRFTIVLSEPLKAQDQTVAIPTGTQLVAQVDSVSKAGVVQVEAIAAIVDHAGQKIEIPLPAGAIQIQGKGGEPLIAQRHRDKETAVASKGLETVALNAIRRASESYNRSNSGIVINNGSLITSKRNSSPNLAAGILQGATESLLDGIAQRNQRAIAEIQQRPEIYYLKAGTKVEVYVNQSVELPSTMRGLIEAQHPHRRIHTNTAEIAKLPEFDETSSSLQRE